MTHLQKLHSNNPWFKPALLFLVKISGVIVFSSLAGMFIGKKLDTYFSISPLCTVALMLAGFIFSIFVILKEIKKYKQQLQ